MEKDASYYFFFFGFVSQQHIKEAIVLDTVVDLIPVTLICNHEAEATELCRTCHALALPFLLQLGSLTVSSSFRHRFDTKKRVSLMLGEMQ